MKKLIILIYVWAFISGCTDSVQLSKEDYNFYVTKSKKGDSLQKEINAIDSIMTVYHYRFCAVADVEDHLTGVFMPQIDSNYTAQIIIGSVEDIRIWDYSKCFEEIWVKQLHKVKD